MEHIKKTQLELFIVVAIAISAVNGAAQVMDATVFLERDTIAVGQEAVAHVILPARSANEESYSVYWPDLPNGVARGELSTTPLHLIYRSTVRNPGRSTVYVLLTDAKGSVVSSESALLTVTNSRLKDLAFSSLGQFASTLAGVVLAFMAFVTQRKYSAWHERRNLERQYRAVLCATIDHIIALMESGVRTVEVPARVMTPGVSQWSDVMTEPCYQSAIAELEKQVKEFNLKGHSPALVGKVKGIRVSLATD